MSTTLQLGDELAPLRIDPVSRTTLALFAGASGDHNPIHIDVDGEQRATLELEVVLADGTRTLLGEAVVALD